MRSAVCIHSDNAGSFDGPVYSLQTYKSITNAVFIRPSHIPGSVSGGTDRTLTVDFVRELVSIIPSPKYLQKSDIRISVIVFATRSLRVVKFLDVSQVEKVLHGPTFIMPRWPSGIMLASHAYTPGLCSHSEWL